MNRRLEQKRLKRLCRFEDQARSKGFCHIAGIDEAGRGPLAGPVVACACMLPEGVLIEGVNDSKQLTPEERLDVYERIIRTSGISYGVGVVDAILIDQINILQATFQAMILAVAALKQKPDYLLIDGNQLPNIDIPKEAIVEGDCLSQSIAAASIIAKQTRDRMMIKFHAKWPLYGFHEHKGYATKRHFEAIERYGPCPIHRKSFEPFKNPDVNDQKYDGL